MRGVKMCYLDLKTQANNSLFYFFKFEVKVYVLTDVGDIVVIGTIKL